MKKLTKKQIILSSLIAVMIIGIAGSYGYLKFVESKLKRTFLPSLTEVVEGEPVNLLLLGSDSRGEKQARSDTIIFLHYDPKKEKAYLVSIPRDSRIYLDGFGYNKINAATSLSGPNLMVKTVNKLTGMKLHHYVMIDFTGFKKLVDALGGIRINVPKAINSNQRGYEMHFSKGWRDMNGTQALNYVRFRHDPRGDLGRIERQQVFFKALSNKLFSIGSLPKAPWLISSFANNVETDMGSGELLDLARRIKAVDDKNITMTTAPGTPRYIYGASYVILDEPGVKKLFADVKAGRPIKAAKAPF